MAGLGNNLKMALLKGMEAVGRGASNMASSAHQKLAEINLETRRREILSEFPMRAFDLWQKGVELPEPLNGMMAELAELDERLSVLRAQRYASVESAQENVEDEASGECSCAGEEATEDGATAVGMFGAPLDAQPAPQEDTPRDESGADEAGAAAPAEGWEGADAEGSPTDEYGDNA